MVACISSSNIAVVRKLLISSHAEILFVILKREKYQRIGLFVCVIYFMYLFQQKRCLRSPKEIMHECNFFVAVVWWKKSSSGFIHFYCAVWAGKEWERESFLCARGALLLLFCVLPSKKEKRRRKILALFAVGVYNHLSCTSDVSVCVSLIHFLFRRRRRATEIQNGSMNI